MKAGGFCKLMTGLSREAVELLWERYGDQFQDETFTVRSSPARVRRRGGRRVRVRRRPPQATSLGTTATTKTRSSRTLSPKSIFFVRRNAADDQSDGDTVKKHVAHA